VLTTWIILLNFKYPSSPLYSTEATQPIETLEAVDVQSLGSTLVIWSLPCHLGNPYLTFGLVHRLPSLEKFPEDLLDFSHCIPWSAASIVLTVVHYQKVWIHWPLECYCPYKVSHYTRSLRKIDRTKANPPCHCRVQHILIIWRRTFGLLLPIGRVTDYICSVGETEKRGRAEVFWKANLRRRDIDEIIKEGRNWHSTTCAIFQNEPSITPHRRQWDQPERQLPGAIPGSPIFHIRRRTCVETIFIIALVLLKLTFEQMSQDVFARK
jgi:hypothetical protein